MAWKRSTEPPVLFSAILADAVDLKVVARGIETIFTANVFFNLGHFGREEFDRSAAFGADHMMMAAAVELMLIARHAVRKGNSAGQAAFGQKLERAIDGGKADLGVLLPHQAEKLVSG